MDLPEGTLDLLNADGSIFETVEHVKMVPVSRSRAVNADTLELGPFAEGRPGPVRARFRLGDWVIGAGPLTYDSTAYLAAGDRLFILSANFEIEIII